MKKDKFLLVSLEEKESKQLAEVLTNPTSKKIIAYLSDHEEATETQLAKALDIPLSTIHYNLQKLKKSKLVSVDEFHYSKKGKEVDHYKLANKYVIITPRPVKGIRSKLKGILPVAAIVVGLGAIIEVMTSVMGSGATFAPRAEPSALVQEAASDLVARETVAATVQQAAPNPHWGLVFIIGGVIALGLYALIVLIRSRR